MCWSWWIIWNSVIFYPTSKPRSFLPSHYLTLHSASEICRDWTCRHQQIVICWICLCWYQEPLFFHFLCDTCSLIGPQWMGREPSQRYHHINYWPSQSVGLHIPRWKRIKGPNEISAFASKDVFNVNAMFVLWKPSFDTRMPPLLLYFADGLLCFSYFL